MQCGLFHQGNGEDTGSAAQSTADGLKQLVSSARGVAATVQTGSNISPNDVLDAVDDILDKSANLIAAAKSAVEDPENPNSKAQLTQVVMVFCYISFVLCIISILTKVSYICLFSFCFIISIFLMVISTSLSCSTNAHHYFL